jgi:hypothetical protein
MSFQLVPNLTADGALEVLDRDGQTPTIVLDRNQDFSIEIDWRTRGAGGAFLGGEWLVTANFESIGNQPNPAPVNLTEPVNATGNYHRTMVIPGTPATITADGVYKLVVSIQHRNFGVKTSMAGYLEYPELLQFYSTP